MIKIIPKSSKEKLSEHLTNAEFRCRCIHPSCRGTLYHSELPAIYEKLRELVGNKKIKVNSGYRCPFHNFSVGDSSSTSYHTAGMAMDLVPPEGLSLMEFAAKMREAGFKYVYFNAAKGFSHGDLRIT